MIGTNTKTTLIKNLICYSIICVNYFSCKDIIDPNPKERVENELEILLKPVMDDEFQFHQDRSVDFPVYSKKKKFPESFSGKLNKMRNIPKVDSFLVVSTTMQAAPKEFFSYLNSYFSKEEYYEKYNIHFDDDTLLLKKNGGIQYQMNAISAFVGNKQIVIPDINNNLDFSDDPELIFPMDFDKVNMGSPQSLDTLPILDFKYQLLIDGKLHDVNRKIQIFPRPNHNHAYLLDDYIDTTTNKYTLMLRLKDYRKGKMGKDGIDYMFALQGKNKFVSIIVKPDSLKNRIDNAFMRSLFEYYVSDTIPLGQDWYKIKSVYPDYSRLVLEVSKSKPKKNKPIDLNKPVSNFSLTGLDGVETSFQILLKDKKYMFIDFWGTWCGPCIKLTPEIIKMNEKHKSKVEFVGVAFDKNVSDVQEYTINNGMNWYQSFVSQRISKTNIISEWNITSFPTFILLDKNGKILYGGGSESLNKIDKLMEKLDE